MLLEVPVPQNMLTRFLQMEHALEYAWLGQNPAHDDSQQPFNKSAQH